VKEGGRASPPASLPPHGYRQALQLIARDALIFLSTPHSVSGRSPTGSAWDVICHNPPPWSCLLLGGQNRDLGDEEPSNQLLELVGSNPLHGETIHTVKYAFLSF